MPTLEEIQAWMAQHVPGGNLNNSNYHVPAPQPGTQDALAEYARQNMSTPPNMGAQPGTANAGMAAAPQNQPRQFQFPKIQDTLSRDTIHDLIAPDEEDDEEKKQHALNNNNRSGTAEGSYSGS
jgi:hypothetical protein